MKHKIWSDKDSVFYRKLFSLVLPIAFQQFMLAAVSEMCIRDRYWEKVQAEQQEQPLPEDRKIQRPGNAPDILRKKTGQEEQSAYNEKPEVDQSCLLYTSIMLSLCYHVTLSPLSPTNFRAIINKFLN